MTVKKIGDFIEEVFGRMMFGFFSAVLAGLSCFIPVWVDFSVKAMNTIGKTTYYGFPIPVRSVASGGGSLDNLVTGLILNIIFWAGAVAWLDLRLFKGKDRKPITWTGFLLNWLFTIGGLVLLILILIGPVTWMYEWAKK